MLMDVVIVIWAFAFGVCYASVLEGEYNHPNTIIFNMVVLLVTSGIIIGQLF